MPVYRKPGRGPETWRVVLGSRTTRQEWIVHGTKREAETFEAQKKLERAAGGAAPRQTQAVYDFATFCAEKYWPHAKKHLRASTLKVRRYQLDTLAKFFGKHRLTTITTEAVEAYKEWRGESYEAATGEPLNTSTINTELTKLQAVLTYAHHIGVPCAKPKVKHMPRVGKRRVHVWTEQQVVDLFAACKFLAPHLLPLLQFMANTGCRPGEAIAAQRPWVDLARRQITIQPNEFWQPKDNEPREVPVGEAIQAIVSRGDSPYLFLNEQGEPWKTFPDHTFNLVRNAAGHAPYCGRWTKPTMGPRRGGVYDDAILEHVARRPNDSSGDIAAALDVHVDLVKSALRRLRQRGHIDGGGGTRHTERAVKTPTAPDVKPRECTCGAVGLRGGPYTLRHTFASNFLLHRPDLQVLAKVMGHDSTKVTEMYFHLLPSHLESARDVVNFVPQDVPEPTAPRRWGKVG